MVRPAACYDAQGNTQHVDETILPTEDHISERIVCAVLLMCGQSARFRIDECTHCASEVSCGFLLHVRAVRSEFLLKLRLVCGTAPDNVIASDDT